MPILSPPAPVNATGQLAQHLPAYDPAPTIAAHEQNLQEYLSLPVKEILARLGLSAPAGAPPEEAPSEETKGEDPPASSSPMDPMGLISPVTDALGTLGSGMFNGADPTSMFQGISQALQSTGGSLLQSLGVVDNSWQGASGTAAKAKTATAIANGTEVAAQSDALSASVATAAADVAQAHVRLIEIITEFQATMAAIGPNIIFPWGWAAAIAAANKAIAMTAEVMTGLQGSLAAEAATTTAVGAPVNITAIPQLGTSPLASMAPQLLSMAAQGAMAGIQAGTGAASSAAAAAKAPTDDASKTGTAMGAVPPGTAPIGGKAGGSGGGGVGAGGAAGPFGSKAMPTSTMVQPVTPPTPAQGQARVGSGTAGMGMMGAPYAPMTGAGLGSNASSNSHTSASFLHTADQGGEIVGDLGTAAPPVLGEADPTEPPDIQLRF